MPAHLRFDAPQPKREEGGGEGRESHPCAFFQRVAHQIATRKSQGPALKKKKWRDLDLWGMQTNERSVLLKPRTYVSADSGWAAGRDPAEPWLPVVGFAMDV